MQFLVLLYPLLVATFFAAVIVDVAYSQLLANTLSISESAALYRNISDRLLRIGFLAFLSGVLALAPPSVPWFGVLYPITVWALLWGIVLLEGSANVERARTAI